jgi:hypothetical protein
MINKTTLPYTIWVIVVIVGRENDDWSVGIEIKIDCQGRDGFR